MKIQELRDEVPFQGTPGLCLFPFSSGSLTLAPTPMPLTTVGDPGGDCPQGHQWEEAGQPGHLLGLRGLPAQGTLGGRPVQLVTLGDGCDTNWKKGTCWKKSLVTSDLWVLCHHLPMM